MVKNTASGESEDGPPLVVFDGGSRSRPRSNAKEWRLFMSSKASDVHRDAAKESIDSRRDDDEESRIKDILKEVEELGTSQMSWEERKAWETRKLIISGGNLPKGHKMPIEMGLNITRKRQKLEEDQLQALGMQPRKKQKKDEKKHRRPEDRGLRVSDGKYKNGVLYVRPPFEKRKEEDFRGGKVHDASFSNEGGIKGKASGKKSSKGKGKGNGKGKKGKKRRR